MGEVCAFLASQKLKFHSNIGLLFSFKSLLIYLS